MPLKDKINDFYRKKKEPITNRITLKRNLWLRIEGRNRQQDLEDNLAMRTADPLWMLGRQWQFGEFQGEDNGSPIGVKVMNRQLATELVFDSDDDDDTNDSVSDFMRRKDAPIEAQVECTSIPLAKLPQTNSWKGLQACNDWRNRVRIGQQLEQYIIEKFSSDEAEKMKKLFPIKLPNDIKGLDKRTISFIQIMTGKCIDGGLVMYEYCNQLLKNRLAANDIDTLISDVLVKDYLMPWYQSLFLQPLEKLADNPSWESEILTHKFKITDAKEAMPIAIDGNKKILINAPDYQGVHLDWYSFDNSMINEEIKGEQPERIEEHIPINITFGGMPNKRLFAFEDNKINIGNLEVQTPDLVKMMLMEFALSYSNDWFIVPLELKPGTICWIDKLEVKDVFGVTTSIANGQFKSEYKNGYQTKTIRTDIGPILKKDPLGVWDVFKIRENNQTSPVTEYIPKDHFLYLPKTVPFKQESKPYEEIVFMRDEYTNMVWAEEKTILNGLGKAKNGFDFHQETTPELNLVNNIASTLPQYRLSNVEQVPYNWIPYVPRRKKDSEQIVLRRAKLAKTIEEATAAKSCLVQNLPLINEANITKGGTRLLLTKQRVRWANGETFVWMGRKVKVGKGEGESGLKFDYLKD